jgi:hypothetical protein
MAQYIVPALHAACTIYLQHTALDAQTPAVDAASAAERQPVTDGHGAAAGRQRRFAASRMLCSQRLSYFQPCAAMLQTQATGIIILWAVPSVHVIITASAPGPARLINQ